MDFIRLFKREESVGGLAVSDNGIKLSLLQFDNKHQISKITTVEEPLPSHTVINGTINNEKLFVRALNNLLKKSPRLNFVILSLPSDNVYTKFFSFPKSIAQHKLPESIKLQIEYQLPMRPDTVYLDWEIDENKNNSEIFLAAIPKNIVDQYVKTLSAAGLKTVAVEIHPCSLLRTIDLPKGPFAVTVESDNSAYIYIFFEQKLRYQRTIPKQLKSTKTLQQELKKVLDFYEASNPKIEKVVKLERLEPLKQFKTKSEFLVSLGAAVRGAIPRSKDNLISLMPIGTEKAYEFERAQAFTKFVFTLSIILSTFFIFIYIGAWVLISNIHQRTINQVEALSALPLDENTANLEAKARKIEGLIQLAYPLTRDIPLWSKLLDELRTKTPVGITILNLNVAEDGSLTMSGQAQSRTILNQFKKSLEDSPYISRVDLPLLNLEQKSNIPFGISAQVRLDLLNFENKLQ